MLVQVDAISLSPEQWSVLFNQSFNEFGISNYFVSVHMCFNNFDAWKFVCIKM
jgi:hypothetical protein